MTITPDTKDWTWVLQRPCPECGLDARTLDARDVAGLLRRVAARWPAALASGDAGRRPDPATWSPLEYACHVRDTCRTYTRRLALMLEHDDPLFPNWDQDETAVRDRYGEQDPAVVARKLVAAAQELAGAFDAVPPAAWGRPGRRSDGASFTVDTFARYFVHDPVHHYWDVTRTPARDL